MKPDKESKMNIKEAVEIVKEEIKRINEKDDRSWWEAQTHKALQALIDNVKDIPDKPTGRDKELEEIIENTKFRHTINTPHGIDYEDMKVKDTGLPIYHIAQALSKAGYRKDLVELDEGKVRDIISDEDLFYEDQVQAICSKFGVKDKPSVELKELNERKLWAFLNDKYGSTTADVYTKAIVKKFGVKGKP